MNYETLNWDAGWSELVDPIVRAYEADEFDEVERLEKIYERRHIISADCKLHAERLLANLRVKYPEFEFAAHADALDHPPYSSWGVLVRSPKRHPLSKAEIKKVGVAANAILKNIEKKYPSISEQPQKKSIEKSSRKGCFWVLLLILGLVGILRT